MLEILFASLYCHFGCQRLNITCQLALRSFKYGKTSSQNTHIFFLLNKYRYIWEVFLKKASEPFSLSYKILCLQITFLVILIIIQRSPIVLEKGKEKQRKNKIYEIMILLIKSPFFTKMKAFTLRKKTSTAVRKFLSLAILFEYSC